MLSLKKYLGAPIISLLLLASLFLSIPVGAINTAPELISKSSTGEESNMGISGSSEISDNGRYILYTSFSTNLGGQRPGDEGLYLYDRDTQITTLVSIDSEGQQAAGPHVLGYELSGDGRHVAFGSHSIVDQGSGRIQTNIYVRDLDAGTTTLVSLDENDQPVPLSTPIIALSYDGSVIAFLNNTYHDNDLPNIYIRDIPSGTVSVIADQTPQQLWLSDDGNKLLYNNTYMAPPSINGQQGMPVVYDRLSGTTQVGRYEADGSPTTLNDAWAIALSGNGRYVLAHTYRCASEPPDGDGCVLRTDMETQTTQELPGIDPIHVSTSSDGSLITYGGGGYSACDGSVCNDIYPPIYLYNVGSGTTHQVSEAPDGTELGSVLISGNGEMVTFFTGAANFGVTVGQQVFALALNVSDSEEVVLNPSADTYLRGGQTNRNHGADTEMKIQSSGNNRALIRFSQQALQSSIGNRTVLSATLRLAIMDNGNNWGSAGRTIDLHRLLKNWSEGNGTANNRGTGQGATWDCAVDSNIQNQSKDCSGVTEWEMGQPNNPNVHPWVEAATGTQTITNGQTGTIEFDVTDDLIAFLSGEFENYGWLIKKTNEGQSGQLSFGTKESLAVPRLVIVLAPQD